MNRPWLIIVTGLPATGKTRLARKIAADRLWPLLAKDTIKEWLFESLGVGDAKWSRQLSDASFTILFAVARDVMRHNSDLVLEGNLRPREHEKMLQAMLQSQSASAPRCIQILCRVDEVERRRRLHARRADPARHAGHLDATQRLDLRGVDGFLDLPGDRLLHDSGAVAFDNVLMRLAELLA